MSSLLVFLLLLPPREDAATLIQRVLDFQEQQQELARQYRFTERVTTQFLSKRGTVTRSESETFRVTPGPGGEYRRLLRTNGRPLPPHREAEEERKFQEYLESQLALTAEARKQRTKDKLESRVARYQSRLKEALEVFDFTALPDRVTSGERLRVFHFEPKPGYRGHSRATQILQRIEGTIWIDARRNQIARLHLVFTENMGFLGGIFGKISKGSEALAEAWIDDDLWLMDRIEVTLNARFYFLKRYRRRLIYAFSDYRKYRVETMERVTPKRGVRR